MNISSTNWTNLYIFNKQSENFKLVYSDEINVPLSVYNGKLIGPIKIWEISYPQDINTKSEYLLTYYPDPELI